MTFSFYEFFAGGGMARAGLGSGWKCLFANDFDRRKNRSYRLNWADDVLMPGDVREVKTADIPDKANLAWASFPCQDLSLAGSGVGLNGERSGTFWPFWEIMVALTEEGRAPQVIALENVSGTLNSHGGADFRAIVEAFIKLGYRVGAVIINAVMFLPHSRPRLFVIGVRRDLALSEQQSQEPTKFWHPQHLRRAYSRLSEEAKRDWVWWNMPLPPPREGGLASLLEDEPQGVRWHTPAETQRLLDMMNGLHREKVRRAQADSGLRVGAVYKRTRRDPSGNRIQRAEVRFDDVSGCLRTPVGGSSRQLLLIVKDHSIRSRLISTRETARLMGLPDDYALPENYNEGYHLTGDGVVVPAVRHLAKHVLEPVLASANGTAPGGES